MTYQKVESYRVVSLMGFQSFLMEMKWAVDTLA